MRLHSLANGTSSSTCSPDVSRSGKLWICIPVFNDSKSAFALVRQLDQECKSNLGSASILFVDDGSWEFDSVSAFVSQLKYIEMVRVLRLSRNLGHQRAIAIGLGYLSEEESGSDVVVMDGDGEDAAIDVARLANAASASDHKFMVFAKRAKRTEGFRFRVGLLCFQVLHYILVGKPANIGNFSYLPANLLGRLITSPELWMHYAATAEVSRLPLSRLPIDRSQRIFGSSRMNIESLVLHGLAAISVHSDRVSVRVLGLLGLLVLAGFLLCVLGAIYRLSINEPLPGWFALSLLAIAIGSMTVALFALLFVFGLLLARKAAPINPAMAWRQFAFEVESYPVHAEHRANIGVLQ